MPGDATSGKRKKNIKKWFSYVKKDRVNESERERMNMGNVKLGKNL